MLTHIHIWNDVQGEGETGKSRSWPGPCTNVAEGMDAESDVVENI